MTVNKVGTVTRAASRGRAALSMMLALCVANLLSLAPASAQQKGDVVAQLREQIAEMSKVDADAETPPEIRSANRGFLDDRRAQLVGVLKYKAEALRNYLSTVGVNLTSAEK